MAVNGSFIEYCGFVKELNVLGFLGDESLNERESCWACPKVVFMVFVFPANRLIHFHTA